jgi:hypothetical protein
MRSLAAAVIGNGQDQERQAPHLLSNRSRQQPADAVRQPTGGLHELLHGGSARPFQQFEQLLCFAALARAASRRRLETPELPENPANAQPGCGGDRKRPGSGTPVIRAQGNWTPGPRFHSDEP